MTHLHGCTVPSGAADSLPPIEGVGIFRQLGTLILYNSWRQGGSLTCAVLSINSWRHLNQRKRLSLTLISLFVCSTLYPSIPSFSSIKCISIQWNTSFYIFFLSVDLYAFSFNSEVVYYQGFYILYIYIKSSFNKLKRHKISKSFSGRRVKQAINQQRVMCVYGSGATRACTNNEPKAPKDEPS